MDDIISDLQCGPVVNGDRDRLPERTLEDATAVTSYRLLSAALRSLRLPSSPEQHYDAYRMDGWAANDAGGRSTLATDTFFFREVHASPAECRRALLDAVDPYAAERGPSATPGEPQRLNASYPLRRRDATNGGCPL